jgi:hypothetical protein
VGTIHSLFFSNAGGDIVESCRCTELMLYFHRGYCTRCRYSPFNVAIFFNHFSLHISLVIGSCCGITLPLARAFFLASLLHCRLATASLYGIFFIFFCGLLITPKVFHFVTPMSPPCHPHGIYVTPMSSLFILFYYCMFGKEFGGLPVAYGIPSIRWQTAHPHH